MSQEETVLLLHWHCCARLHLVWYVDIHSVVIYQGLIKQPLPLMNIIFGNLVGEFQGYFMPGTQVTEGEFKASVNRLR